ncbi:nitroreductase [Catellatospora sp. NPDC049111]|uniref:Acg family FMN-binding oxidoreductase n=1 Tax=Catellatospora sp. NPDC049111 TaxID=3155271 RepID=UPI0033D947B4
MDATSLQRRGALIEAARDALAAPSIFNTQPWTWRSADDWLQLWADPSRRLRSTDFAGRQLTISCGAALHHARVALAAAGHQVQVDRIPDPGSPGLLARIAITGAHVPTEEEVALYRAIGERHTDRRAFTAEAVACRVLGELVAAAEQQAAHLYAVPTGQVNVLGAAAAHAEAVHQADPGYRDELMTWTNRPADSGDGVPATTAVTPTTRAVPVRDFTLFGRGHSAGPERDTGAQFAMIFTDGDDVVDWLRAGEALSAVLLAATVAQLGSAPISDVIEVRATREQLGRLLQGGGHPQSVVRVGHPPAGRSAASPRRAPPEVINP